MDLTNKIAYMNLSNRHAKTVTVPTDLSRRLLGGRGFAGQLLLQELPPHTDALSPGNVIVVSVGLLDGMLAPGAAFTYLAAKSPLTGFLGMASLGGYFGVELRRAGFDHLVISGKSNRPALILLRDGKITVHDASSVWGRDIPDTQEILRKQFEDDDIQSLCIGPAGEQQIRFAGVATRYESARMQSGMGAVFGSKNLKAIVARGSKDIPIANPVEATQHDQALTTRIQASLPGKGLIDFGQASLEGADEVWFPEETVGTDSCFGCQLHCRRRFVIKSGRQAGTYGQAPGYPETLCWKEATGDSDNQELLSTVRFVDSCGMDTSEAAGLVQWARELTDRGLLDQQHTSGPEIKFTEEGDAIRFLQATLNREGLGAVFADGAARAADKIAQGAQYIREAKGLSCVFLGEALSPWQVLGAATASTGCDLLRYASPYEPCRLTDAALASVLNQPVAFGTIPSGCNDYGTAPQLVRWTQNLGMVLDILGICDLNSVLVNPEAASLADYSKTLLFNNGIQVSTEELWQVAERAINLERMLNIREGYQGRSEQFVNCCVGKAMAADAITADGLQYDAALSRYYSLRGWDANGVPRVETLQKLGLSLGR